MGTVIFFLVFRRKTEDDFDKQEKGSISKKKKKSVENDTGCACVASYPREKNDHPSQRGF